MKNQIFINYQLLIDKSESDATRSVSVAEGLDATRFIGDIFILATK